MKDKRLRGILQAVAAAAVIALVAALVLGLIALIDHKLKQSAEQQVVTFTQQAAGTVDDRMFMMQNAVGSFEVQSSEAQAIVPALATFKERFGFADVAFAGMDGQGYLSDGSAFSVTTMTQQETALAEGKQSYTNTYINAEEQCVRLAQRPLFIDGQQVGALYVQIPLDKFTIPKSLDLFDGRGYFMVFEASSGEILVPPCDQTQMPINDETTVFTFLEQSSSSAFSSDAAGAAESSLTTFRQSTQESWDELRSAVAAGSSALVSATIDGKPSYVCAAPVANGSWYVCSVIPVQNVRAEASLVTTTFLGVFCIVFACVAIVSRLLFSAYRRRISERNLAMTTRLYQALSDSLDLSVNLYSPVDGQMTPIVEKTTQIIGYPLDEFLKDEALEQRMSLSQDGTVLFNRVRTNAIDDFERGEFSLAGKEGGTTRWVSYSVKPLDFGDKKQLLIVLRDVTADKELQVSMREAMYAAEAANQAKSEFLSRMSHEIRTPMNTIIGMLNIAQRDIDSKEKTQHSLAKIESASDHLLGLINNVLDISKIENGKMALSSQRFRLSDLLNELVDIVRTECERKQLTFSFVTTPVADTLFMGDEVRLKQLLLNLLTNAVKYTEVGGSVCFKVDIEPQSATGCRCVEFTVSDTGIGMSEEFLEKHLFEPFAMEERSDERGTGLGMAIARNIVMLLGGTMECTSQMGVGTEFRVSMNLRVALPGTESLVENEAGLSGEAPEDGQAPKSGQALEGGQMTESGQAPKSTQKEETCKQQSRSEALRAAAEAPVLPITLSSAATRYAELPLLDEADTSEPQKESTPDKAASLIDVKSGDLAGVRALLAEDNQLNAEITIELLRDSGLAIEHAKDGEQACQMFEESPVGYYNIVLMDVQMPNLDGHGATRCIRSLSREDAASVPIVALSANAFTEDIQASLASGMNAHLSKPFDVKQVLSTIAQYVR